MARPFTTLLAVLLVVGALVASPAAALAPSTAYAQEETPTATPMNTTNATNTSNTSNATVAPGERFAGVVGVQHAEVEGEIETRAFGLELAGAATAEARADIVAERLEQNRQRLDDLDERKAALTAARENGSLSEGAYRAQIAVLASETVTVERTLTQSADASADLPAELLAEKGINVTAIQTLKANASALSGGEVAEIARSIAGKGPGANAEDARVTNAGERAPNASEREGNRTVDQPETEQSSTTNAPTAEPPTERGERQESDTGEDITSTSTTETDSGSDETSETGTKTETSESEGTQTTTETDDESETNTTEQSSSGGDWGSKA